MQVFKPTDSRGKGLLRRFARAAAACLFLAAWGLSTHAAGTNPPAAVNWLKKAARAPTRVSYKATELLLTRDHSGTQRQEARVMHLAPHDTRWEYLTAKGETERVVGDNNHYHWQYLPKDKEVIFSPHISIDHELWEQKHLDDLVENYVVSDAGEQTLENRRARLLTIAPRPKHLGPAKRLWVDTETGLILRSEVTFADGKTKLTTALQNLRLAEKPSAAVFLPPSNAKRQRVIYNHVAVLPLGSLARQWKHPLLTARYLPAGYELESARLVRQSRSAFVYLRYFDGLNTISLFQSPASLPRRTVSPQRRGDTVNGAAASWQFNSPFWSLTWRDGGTKLTLMSALPQEELLRIARGVARFSR